MLFATSVSHPNLVSTYHISTLSGTQRTAAANAWLEDSANNSGSSCTQGSVGDSRSSSGASGSDDSASGLVTTWIVMELCPRGSLELALKQGKLKRADGTPDMVGIYKALLDTASGLDNLHSIGVVHGDLKTANVLLKGSAKDARGFTYKITDFGLSRVLDMNASHISTATHGTLLYMPKELLLSGRITQAADIYSFGLMMWELFTSKSVLEPDEGLSVGQMFYMIAYQDWRPDAPQGCPTAYADLMTACWHADPEQRPTAQQLLRRLQMLQGQTRQGLAAAKRMQLPSPGSTCASGQLQMPTADSSHLSAAAAELGNASAKEASQMSATPEPAAWPLTAANLQARCCEQRQQLLQQQQQQRAQSSVHENAAVADANRHLQLASTPVLGQELRQQPSQLELSSTFSHITRRPPDSSACGQKQEHYQPHVQPEAMPSRAASMDTPAVQHNTPQQALQPYTGGVAHAVAAAAAAETPQTQAILSSSLAALSNRNLLEAPQWQAPAGDIGHDSQPAGADHEVFVLPTQNLGHWQYSHSTAGQQLLPSAAQPDERTRAEQFLFFPMMHDMPEAGSSLQTWSAASKLALNALPLSTSGEGSAPAQGAVSSLGVDALPEQQQQQELFGVEDLQTASSGPSQLGCWQQGHQQSFPKQQLLQQQQQQQQQQWTQLQYWPAEQAAPAILQHSAAQQYVGTIEWAHRPDADAAAAAAAQQLLADAAQAHGTPAAFRGSYFAAYQPGLEFAGCLPELSDTGEDLTPADVEKLQPYLLALQRSAATLPSTATSSG